jgi:peptidoglycan/xylan/chitin deacetylase (PgdA/CDA1 family)
LGLLLPNNQFSNAHFVSSRFKKKSRYAFNKSLAFIFIASMMILSLVSVASIQASFAAPPGNATPCNCVIFRMDDIQDTYMNTVQAAVMNEFINRNANFSVAVIMNRIGSDPLVIGKVNQGAATNLFELDLHGWDHVDYSQLTYTQQKSTLQLANQKMQSIWGRPSKIFIPPFAVYNTDTLQAMKDLNLKIISVDSYTDLDVINQNQLYKAYSGSDISDDFGVYHMPHVIEFYNQAVSPPQKNSVNTIISTVNDRIKDYGFAVITMHPTDFAVRDSAGNPTNVASQIEINDLDSLISYYKTEIGPDNKPYSIKTFSAIAGLPLAPLVDNQPPAIVPPPNKIIISQDPFTLVDIGTPTVTDNTDPAPTYFNNAPGDNNFPQGTSVVTWTARDKIGNTGNAYQFITISKQADTIIPNLTITKINNQPYNPSNPPTITGPSTGVNIRVDGIASDAETGVKRTDIVVQPLFPYKLATPKAQPIDWSSWSAIVTAKNASNQINIQAKAMDFYNNTRWTPANNYVKVVLGGTDVTAPEIQAPADITIEATGIYSGATLGSPYVFDDSDLNPIVTNDFPGVSESSGFVVGVNHVTWTAKDVSGNSASAIQTVTVVDSKPPTVPNPTSPTDQSTSVSVTPTLVWDQSSDIASDVTYQLRVSDDPLFGSFVVQQDSIQNSNYSITSPLSTGTTYYWKVLASDFSGNKSPFSQPFSFATVDSSPADTTPPIVSASPPAGNYNVPQSITLTANEPAVIYYTTNGADPNLSSSHGTSPVSGIIIGSTGDLKFFGVDSANNTGSLVSAHYIISNNSAPVASAGSFSTNQGIIKSFTLNATDADGNPLTYSIVGAPSHGSVSPGTGSNRTYTPAAGFFGSDSFTFKANDGQADSNTATVSITVNPVSQLKSTTLALNISPTSVIWGGSVTVSGKLTDTATGAGIPNAIITLNGTGPANMPSIPSTITTSADGNFSVTAASPSLVQTGWTIRALFAGASSYQSSDSPVKTFDTTKHAVTVTVSSSASSIRWGQPITLTATLKDSSLGGATISKAKTITFGGTGVASASFASTSSLTSTSTGVASISGSVPTSVQNGWTYQAHFVGDSLYSAKDSTIKTYSTTIHTTSLSLTLSPGTVSRGGLYSATVVLTDSITNTPISGKIITFTATSPIIIASKTTNTAGAATANDQIAPLTTGKYQIQAHFAGTSLYGAKDSSSRTLTVR